MNFQQFYELIYQTKPHKRFVIYNCSNPEEIKLWYNLIFTNPVQITKNLEISDGDLVWIDSFGIPTDNLIDNILTFTTGNFFEIICTKHIKTSSHEKRNAIYLIF